MFNKYHALMVASVIGAGAFAMPASVASAGALTHMQQKAILMESDNPLLVEVKRDRDGRHWRHNRGHGKWNNHRRHRHRHHGHDGFALYVNPFFFGGGYGYYNDDWCFRRYGYYSWRCRYYQ